MLARSLKLFLVTALLVSTSGCADDPVLGQWRSTEKLANGERNELWFYKDQSGEATLYATAEGQPESWAKVDFKLDWEDKGDSSFELDMECDESFCNGDDFTMECEGFEERSGSLKLDCEGDGKWTDYIFNWEPA